MLPYLAHVHLEPPVTPLHDEVRVDLDCEVAVVDLQDLKVVQPDLHLEKVFLKIVQPNLHLGKVFLYKKMEKKNESTSEGGFPGGLRGGLNLL